MSRQTALIAGMIACIAVAGAAAGTRLTRASLQALERNSDQSFLNMLEEDPFSMLGLTRGVYLEGYGVVFSSEIDLAPRTNLNPFRSQQFTKEEIAAIKFKKQVRVNQLREQMQAMLVKYAKTLELQPAENIAIAVTIPYSRLEDTQGMPRQIVMSAAREALLGSAPAGPSIKVQEFF